MKMRLGTGQEPIVGPITTILCTPGTCQYRSWLLIHYQRCAGTLQLQRARAAPTRNRNKKTQATPGPCKYKYTPPNVYVVPSMPFVMIHYPMLDYRCAVHIDHSSAVHQIASREASGCRTPAAVCEAVRWAEQIVHSYFGHLRNR